MSRNKIIFLGDVGGGGAPTAVLAASPAASSGLIWVSDGADRSAVATDTLPTLSVTTLNITNFAFATLTADGQYAGFVHDGTAGTTLAFGDLCYLAAADSRWELVDADAEATSGPLWLGMCVLAAAGDGSATRMLVWGKIRADAAFPTFTINAPVYASTTPGAVQTAQPSGTDDVIRIVGYGVTGDVLWFQPSNEYIVHT